MVRGLSYLVLLGWVLGCLSARSTAADSPATDPRTQRTLADPDQVLRLLSREGQTEGRVEPGVLGSRRGIPELDAGVEPGEIATDAAGGSAAANRRRAHVADLLDRGQVCQAPERAAGSRPLAAAPPQRPRAPQHLPRPGDRQGLSATAPGLLQTEAKRDGQPLSGDRSASGASVCFCHAPSAARYQRRRFRHDQRQPIDPAVLAGKIPPHQQGAAG